MRMYLLVIIICCILYFHFEVQLFESFKDIINSFQVELENLNKNVANNLQRLTDKL